MKLYKNLSKGCRTKGISLKSKQEKYNLYEKKSFTLGLENEKMPFLCQKECEMKNNQAFGSKKIIQKAFEKWSN